MGRFSEIFASRQARIGELAALTEPLRTVDSIFHAAEAASGLAVEDVASLLAWARDPSRHEELHGAARRVRERLSPRTIEIVIPEYLTSFCQNDCLYCGYRKSNPLAERVRLSLDEYERELDLILAWGHRQIELVLADDAEFGPEVLASCIALTKRKLAAVGGGLVALNAPAYEEADYRRLRAAGLDWVALWQETYDQPHFDRWHFAGSPKRQFEFRLDVWDRAVAAGFTRVALGVLFGLYDWRYDVLALVEHAGYLRQTYGIEPYALGIPRLKPARGVLASQKPSRFTVSDEDFRLAISICYLAFPCSRLFLNTRESYEFNMAMVAPGDLFTVDCETLPGAYLRGRVPGQFTTHAYPPRHEVVRAFESRGFTCRFLAPAKTAPAADMAGGSEDSAAPPLLGAERCWQEHGQIRARLADWELALDRLKSIPALERRTAAWALRDFLKFFETVVVGHCRYEESVVFASLDPQREELQASKFRQEHERFGIDLDRFERQLTSYELSGDPTVLVTLGARIISEFRRHLEAEEEALRNWCGARAAVGPPAARVEPAQ